MLNFIYTDHTLTAVELDFTPGAKNRNDFRTLSDAAQVALDATNLTGDHYIATDEGRSCSPRYDVILAPKVGAQVSYGFNGDYYPAGAIVRVSKSLRRVETDLGHVFYRRAQTSRWVKDGTWSMVPGRHDRRNPSF